MAYGYCPGPSSWTGSGAGTGDGDRPRSSNLPWRLRPFQAIACSAVLQVQGCKFLLNSLPQGGYLPSMPIRSSKHVGNLSLSVDAKNWNLLLCQYFPINSGPANTRGFRQPFRDYRRGAQDRPNIQRLHLCIRLQPHDCVFVRHKKSVHSFRYHTNRSIHRVYVAHHNITNSRATHP